MLFFVIVPAYVIIMCRAAARYPGAIPDLLASRHFYTMAVHCPNVKFCDEFRSEGYSMSDQSFNRKNMEGWRDGLVGYKCVLCQRI